MIDFFQKIKTLEYEVNLYISKISGYKNHHLIANQLLSRNFFTTNFVKRVYAKDDNYNVSFLKILNQLKRYFKSSFKHFYLYIKIFFANKKKQKQQCADKEIYLIDVFLVIDNVIKNNSFKDSYFDGLYEVLEKENKKYIFIPTIYDDNRNLEKYKNLFSILQNRDNVILEFEVLNIIDLVKILFFIILYPFCVLLLKPKTDNKALDRIFYDELIDSLYQVSFYHYARFLYAKKLAPLFKNNHIKLIAWYENQPHQKYLFKGLKENHKNIKIFGAQPFINPMIYFSVNPLTQEKEFSVIPDEILVNGKFFLKDELNYKLSPSLRYKKLFNYMDNKLDKSRILVLLPYLKDKAYFILDTLMKTKYKDIDLIIKTHPALTINRDLYPSIWEFSDKNIYELFQISKLIIGSMSSSLIEAICIKKTVLVLEETMDILDSTINFIATDVGFKEIWDIANSTIEIEKKIEGLLNFNNQNRAEEIANYFKDNFFYEINYKTIKEAFEIRNS